MIFRSAAKLRHLEPISTVIITVLRSTCRHNRVLAWCLTPNYRLTCMWAIYFHIQALRNVWSSLSADITNSVACTIVGARLDCSNSVMYAISDNNMSKLQHIQSTLARVITDAKKREHILPVLQKLHWLPGSAQLNIRLLWLHQQLCRRVFLSICQSQFSQLCLHGIFALMAQTYSMFLRPNPHLTSPTEITATPYPQYGTVYRLTYEHSRWRQLSGHVPNTFNDTSSLRFLPGDHEIIMYIRFDSKSFDTKHVTNSSTYLC